MEQSKIDSLRIAVNQFYLNKFKDKPRMSDEQFDKLRHEYECETGSSVKDLVEWESGLTSINDPLPPLDKIAVNDNDLASAVKNYMGELGPDRFYINYKYDGSSIKAYYERGVLSKILGTPDEKYGIIRTESFWNLFPHNVDPSIKSIQGEVLVDASVYGELARNAANGLTNSKYKEQDIEREAFIRVYKLEFVDGSTDFDLHAKMLTSLPNIWKTRYRSGEDQESKVKHTDLVFAPAQRLTYNQVPTGPIITDDNGVKFQVDGVVTYGLSKDKEFFTQGFKFYYTQSAVTTVRNIRWNKKDNGSYASVVEFDPIILADKTIQKASTNGVPKMIELECGIGAEVRIILANTTIPKIIEVLKPSTNFNYPKCTCGYELSEKDIYGSTLKCGNINPCLDKVDSWVPEVSRWIVEEDLFKEYDTVLDCIRNVPHWFGYLFHIDRWDAFDCCRIREDIEKDETVRKTVAEKFIEAIRNCDKKAIEEWLVDYFNITSDLQWSLVNVNISSAITVMNILIDKSIEKLKDNYQ